MQTADIEQKIRSILAHELGADPASIGEDTTVETNPLWDSVKHVDILFALQDAFGLEFEHFEAEEMLSYPQIVSVVAKKISGETSDYWKSQKE
jgi:acyl carrier protein